MTKVIEILVLAAALITVTIAIVGLVSVMSIAGRGSREDEKEEHRPGRD